MSSSFFSCLSSLRMLLALAFLMIVPIAPTLAATAEVTKSGSNYIVKVDGTQVYSGTNYTDALLQAAGTGNRIMNIRVGGTITSTIRLRQQSTLNYYPTSERIVLGNIAGPGFYAYKSSGIVFNGLRLGGNAYYGIRLSSCGGASFNNINLDFGGNPVAVGLRVDNEGSTRVSGLTIRNARVANIQAGGDRQGIETYGVDYYDIDGVTAYNIGGCGLLINNGNNGRIGSVYGDRCGNGTTYAALRFANNCNGATVNYADAKNSARGLFILNSTNIQVNRVLISNCSVDTIWIQNGSNNDVLAGNVYGRAPVITNSPGSMINVVYTP